MFRGSNPDNSRKEASRATPKRFTVEVGPNISCLSKKEELKLLNNYNIHIIILYF